MEILQLYAWSNWSSNTRVVTFAAALIGHAPVQAKDQECEKKTTKIPINKCMKTYYNLCHFFILEAQENRKHN